MKTIQIFLSLAVSLIASVSMAADFRPNEAFFNSLKSYPNTYSDALNATLLVFTQKGIRYNRGSAMAKIEQTNLGQVSIPGNKTFSFEAIANYSNPAEDSATVHKITVTGGYSSSVENPASARLWITSLKIEEVAVPAMPAPMH